MGNAGLHDFQAGILRKTQARRKKVSWWGKRWLPLSAAGFFIIALAVGVIVTSQPEYVTAPEAPKILAAQEDLDFGILIPSYMPRGFNRETVELKIDHYSGPNGKPIAELTYRNLGKRAAIFIRQWVPGNPELENLNKSLPIETGWGKGFLMTQGGEKGIGTLWVMVGQLRVAVSSSNLAVVSEEQLLQMANTLGLATEEQAYSFKMDPVEIHGVVPPPPVEIPVNAEGIQEFNLTITPGGYDPIRFAVKKGIPVKIKFRALGEVGCGVSGVITQPEGNISISVTKAQPLSIIEFTPETAGEFPYYCSSNCYRGVMFVREQE